MDEDKQCKRALVCERAPVVVERMRRRSEKLCWNWI